MQSCSLLLAWTGGLCAINDVGGKLYMETMVTISSSAVEVTAAIRLEVACVGRLMLERFAWFVRLVCETRQ